ncbi:MAG TPA: ComF family protein [Verrucomicrobiae bacterium]|nr:ComF family protein [Verrucomicrobiae bacterium]
MNSVIQSVSEFLGAGLGLIYPEICQVCGEGRAGRRDSYLCERCRRSIQFVQKPFCERCGLPFQGAITQAFECADCKTQNWAFSHARSAVIAGDTMLDVIHKYKYRRALWFEPFLGQLLTQCAAPELSKTEWNFIVPVPLHPTKLREREFNQAQRLAHRLSQAIHVPVNERLLRRTVPTRTQTLLSREERMENVRKAFAARTRARLKGERIVLVDDVFTTGATTGACARVLMDLGAGEVCVWTVARGI